MKYEIKGTPLPVVEITLEPGESIKCEQGGMSWMTSSLQMETGAGGLKKMFGRGLTGESVFQNTYTAVGGAGTIGIASSFPGSIIAIEVGPGRELVCQKSAYLASTPGVEISVFFQKKLGAGFFGGEGFIMQKISGTGLVFLEIDGSAVEKTLGPGETLTVDTGYLAYMDATCKVDVVTVKGVKNVLFGGEGLFNTVVTGPGKIALQSMPASQLAAVVASCIPKSN